MNIIGFTRISLLSLLATAAKGSYRIERRENGTVSD